MFKGRIICSLSLESATPDKPTRSSQCDFLKYPPEAARGRSARHIKKGYSPYEQNTPFSNGWPLPKHNLYYQYKKLQVLMINKNLRESLACRKGNDILIWSWNNPLAASVAFWLVAGGGYCMHLWWHWLLGLVGRLVWWLDMYLLLGCILSPGVNNEMVVHKCVQRCCLPGWIDVILQLPLWVSSFLELAAGYAKMCLKIDPILFNWIHPVPGFNCALEFLLLLIIM